MPIIRLKNKQELIKAARIHLVRYFAFTNHINYLNAETICVMNGFRKMDTKESTAYYINRGWMEGEPLKPHGTYVNNCRFVADRQCAIIALCPFPSVMQLYNDIREEDDIDFKSRYRYLRKGAPDDRFHVIARALNAYCRCHPEFEVDGKVEIDEETSLKIAELLSKVRESKGNFIQLGDDEFIAISAQLKKQLDALNRILQTEKKKKKMVISEFNSSFLHDLELAGATLTGDNSYTDLRQRMTEADKLSIDVPKMLQAELRDYQLDGYRWMSRLAH